MSLKTFRLILAISFSAFLICPALAAEEKTRSPEEQAVLQRAVHFYRAKQYPKALAEFKKLEAKDPADLLAKQYVAFLSYLTRDWDQAVLRLNEILNVKKDDLSLRGLLAEIYFKQAKFENASEQYRLIRGQASDEKLKKKAEKRLKEIENLTQVFTASLEGRLGVSEFMNSQPAQDFSKGKFKEALAGFDALVKQYPKDPLIRRFRAMTLARLGRHDEAIAVFQEILQTDPNHVATHFHLGEAYFEKGDAENARKEYQWVVANDQTDYRTRAQHALFKNLGVRTGPQRKPWNVSLTAGYDFDTNSTLKSNTIGESIAGDKNSSRYPLTVRGSYRFFQTQKWRFTADGLYTHTLYQDFPHLNLYTYGAGVSALYSFSLKGKPSFFNLREGATATYLKNKLYVWSNTVTAALITNLTPRSRTTLSYRFSVNEFENNGTDPDLKSRDGFVNQPALTHHFYFNSKRNLYLMAGYDFERQDTSGVNYIRNAHGAQLGFHFPFLAKIEGDIEFRFRDLNYNQYASTPPKRRDDIYTLTVSVTRPLTSYLDLEGSYVFEDSRAKNEAYEYTRQIFSAKATARY